MAARLASIAWPDLGPAEPLALFRLEELEQRLVQVRQAMAARGLSWLIIYGDREHFANLAWLTGIDPRFEEALAVVGVEGDPLLIHGNECEGYLGISPLFAAGRLRSARYQPFSLLDQPRGSSLHLRDLLEDEGVKRGDSVGCAGWKYYRASEEPAAERAIEIPAFIVDILRSLAGDAEVVNATDLLMSADGGLRSVASPTEIAWFEFSNSLASRQLRRMFFALRDGMTDFELVAQAGYTGLPLACHLTVGAGPTARFGFPSPSGAVLRRGEPLAANISYWGSNICRAGWIAGSGRDLPAGAAGYVEEFVGPYFETMADWLALLRPGCRGGDIYDLVQSRLPFERFGIFLNPGHLIHYDEWLSAPVYEGSEVRLRSGMVFQIDVIPSSARWFSTRMEDGVVLADAHLQRELQRRFPAAYGRCLARREFMRASLGLPVPDEVLPLSDMCGIIPPYLLDPGSIMTLK